MANENRTMKQLIKECVKCGTQTRLMLFGQPLCMDCYNNLRFYNEDDETIKQMQDVYIWLDGLMRKNNG